ASMETLRCRPWVSIRGQRRGLIRAVESTPSIVARVSSRSSTKPVPRLANHSCGPFMKLVDPAGLSRLAIMGLPAAGPPLGMRDPPAGVDQPGGDVAVGEPAHRPVA